QGLFIAVFRTKYASDLDRNSGESVVVKKLLGLSLQFIDAFTKEDRLLHDLNHSNIEQFKAVCHKPVAVMLKYLYFDLNVSEERQRSLHYYILFTLT
ncbi:MAG: hypothetical protein MI923_12395, partial [Phycisphaerales bacterium]|nr:hypothetical protein [Phycisphaerales bacterium]